MRPPKADGARERQNASRNGNKNPNCKKFNDDEDMLYAFSFMSQEFVLTQMIEASDAGKPALTPIVENIEHIFADTGKEHANTLDDNFTKRAVGLMVKTILEPFGYAVWKQKDLPKNSGATKFQSASAYRFNVVAPRSMRVVKRIEEIEPIWQGSQAFARQTDSIATAIKDNACQPSSSSEQVPLDNNKTAKIKMYLRIENNNKYIRGKGKVKEKVEQYLKWQYKLENAPINGDYIFYVPYTTIEGLTNNVFDIIQEISDEADYRNCFIETDVACEELGLYW
jgi:hypothetical protein